MLQWGGERPVVDFVMKIYEEEFRTVTQFTHLGNILSPVCTAAAELNQRINKASASFAQMRKRVITNHNLRTATKVTVYRANCLNVLFYVSKPFTLYRRHLRQLDSFHMQCLKKKRTGMVSAECLLLRNGLRWAGYVLRKSECLTLGCPNKFFMDS